MARGVLGNDPFKRGAAKRESEPAQEPRTEKPAAKKKAAAPKAKGATKKAAPKKAKAPKSPAKSAAKRERPVEPELPNAVEVTAATEAAPVIEAPIAPAEERAETAPSVETAETSQPAPTRPEPQPEPAEAWREVQPAHRRVEAGPSLRDRAVGALVRGREVVSHAATSSVLTGFLDTATGVLRAVQTGLGTAGSANLDDYGKDERLARQLGPLSSILYEKYWRVKTEGIDQVPRGPAILVANHSGAIPFDGPVLHEVLRRERRDLAESRWLVEDQIFYAPFLGTLMNRLGAVRACPENAIRLLEEDRPVIVFPEGIHGLSKPWSERYKLMRFGRGGFVKLAIRMRVPIVPVAIVGAEESMPLVARLPGKLLGLPYLPITTPVPLPARWFIRFGEPMSVDEYPPESQSDQVLVNRLNERTRETIQGMLEAILKARESIFA